MLHSCDNRRCVRPDHLFLGTVADNVHDMIRKNRKPLGEQCNRGPLTKDKVLDIIDRHADGQTYGSIARIFGISKGMISHIIRGRQWKHVGAAS